MHGVVTKTTPLYELHRRMCMLFRTTHKKLLDALHQYILALGGTAPSTVLAEQAYSGPVAMNFTDKTPLSLVEAQINRTDVSRRCMFIKS